jgi:hypothetical protein
MSDWQEGIGGIPYFPPAGPSGIFVGIIMTKTESKEQNYGRISG